MLISFRMVGTSSYRPVSMTSTIPLSGTGIARHVCQWHHRCRGWTSLLDCLIPKKSNKLNTNKLCRCSWKRISVIALVDGETTEANIAYAGEMITNSLVCSRCGWKVRIIDALKSQRAILLGLPSGIHSNGYSLVRRVFADHGEKVLPIEGKLRKSCLSRLCHPVKLCCWRLKKHGSLDYLYSGGRFYQCCPCVLLMSLFRKLSEISVLRF